MINVIDPLDLRGVDLNLTRVLLVLLAERSTTRAAERLGVGQPAVSASLARLRTLYRDPLFVRVPRGLEPTARALELGAVLTPALEAIRGSLVPRRSFDPSTAAVSVRLGMPDNHEHVVVPELIARLRREAPEVRIAVRPTSIHSATQLLDEQAIDLACGRVDRVAAWQRRETLGDVGYLCVWDAERVPLKGPLTLDAFLRVPHLLASARGDFSGVVDDALKALGRSRRVVFATATFATLPAVLQRIPAIATVPAPSARRFARDFGLRIAEPPVALQPYQSALVWLAKHDEDPVHRWIRGVVRETALAVLAAPPHEHPRRRRAARAGRRGTRASP